MSEEKKIIIDDDWKSQVAAEKEALKEETQEETPSAEQPPMQMPPASLEMLITSLATEAMMALGQFPNPGSEEVTVQPEHAKYAIDMLSVLEEKTKGNTTPNEEKMFTELLHQLRMMFVAVQNQMAGGPPPA